QLRAEDLGIATKWTNQETASRAINKAFQQWVAGGGRSTTLANWMTKQAQRRGAFDPSIDLKEIRWQVRDEGQLGTVFRRGGTGGVATGNTVVIQLKYVKNHPQKFVVYTAYPK
ncbi:RNase A-like domain-containing protein, partial [Streptomyces sp. NPDC002920]